MTITNKISLLKITERNSFIFGTQGMNKCNPKYPNYADPKLFCFLSATITPEPIHLLNYHND